MIRLIICAAALHTVRLCVVCVCVCVCVYVCTDIASSVLTAVRQEHRIDSLNMDFWVGSTQRS
jgi:hypothetical protein